MTVLETTYGRKINKNNNIRQSTLKLVLLIIFNGSLPVDFPLKRQAVGLEISKNLPLF